MALWLLISTPLAMFGSYFAFKKPVRKIYPHDYLYAAFLITELAQSIENPVRTNQIPRPIPQAPWYMHPAFTILLGGNNSLRASFKPPRN